MLSFALMMYLILYLIGTDTVDRVRSCNSMLPIYFYDDHRKEVDIRHEYSSRLMSFILRDETQLTTIFLWK